jgi:TatD DNase family protein
VIDFHSHLDLYPDPHAIARECAARGLYVLSVTTTPSAWAGTYALAAGMPRVRTALGLHPQIAHERKHELPIFERHVAETRYVGEIGLDGSPELRRHWGDQVEVFDRILALCVAAGGKILSVHSRRAASPVLDQLEKYPAVGVPVLHWFSGTQRELSRAIGLGCWFSVGPAMLAGERGRLLASRMPRERVLTETDGPFAQVDGRPASPWDVDRAVEHLALVWRTSREETTAQLLENLKRIVE